MHEKPPFGCGARRLLVLVAIVWSLGILAFAEWAPIATDPQVVAAPRTPAPGSAPTPAPRGQPQFQHDPRHSIVEVNGRGALLPSAIPLVASIAAACVVWGERGGSRGARRWLLWIAISLGAAAVIGTLLILVPIVALPVAGAILAAALIEERAPKPIPE